MRSHRRLPRDFEQMLMDHGLEILSLRKRTHLVYRVRNVHGVERVVSFPKSPSDRRWILAKRTQLRHIAAERPT